MKKSYIKILTLLGFLIVIILFNTFIKIFNNYTLALTLLIFLGILIFLVGFEKSKHRFKKDVILNIIIYSILYYLFTYFAGVFIGFLRTRYSLTIINIIRNVLPVLLLIITSELLRYELIKKGEGSKAIYIVTAILFILIDMTFLISSYNFSIAEDIIKFICMLLLPTIAKNLMLTYLTYTTGYATSITYRLLFEIPTFILPLFPDLGIYLQSVLGITFPAYVIYKTYKFLQKANMKNTVITSRKEKKTAIIAYVVIFTVFVVIAYLTSGIGNLYAITIGSGSMSPVINKGDIVIVNKLYNSEVKKVEEGEILVFKHADKLIIHRVVDKMDSGSEVYYFTKGDANDSEDGYPIPEEDVVGTAKLRIPWIGYPTIIISELVERSN